MAVQAVSGNRDGVQLVRLAHEPRGAIHAAALAQSVADRDETGGQSEARAPNGSGSEAEERSEDHTVERVLTPRAMNRVTIAPPPGGSTSRKTLALIR